MDGNTQNITGAFQWPYTLSPYDSGMIIEDTWPTIFFGAERLDEIRRKTDTLPWASDALAQMQQEAETVLKTPPQLPEERIGWRHDFYSHTTAEHLVYDLKSPHRFLDPIDQSYHASEVQHRAWTLLTHERTYRLMRSLGLLYGLTGDERYAKWVAEGMRLAAKFFTHEEFREGNHGGALYFQPLYDAQVLALMANAYSCTHKSTAYSKADHQIVRKGIFEVGMPSQIQFFERTGAHNMTCYVGACLALSGEAIDRDDWRQMGFGGDRGGLPALLRDGLRTDAKGQVDGFWFEGTMFYHFYSVCPMVTVYEMLRQHGAIDPEISTRFEKLFEAPIRMCDQNLDLPCVGDLGAPGARSLAIYRHLYEYAAGQFGGDLFTQTLSSIYQRGIPRNSLTALAFGPDNIDAKPFSQKSTHLPAMGFGIFREDTSEGSFYLLFKGGSHGAGHDHPDKLSIDIRALGEQIAPDLGTAGYAVKNIYTYYRSTLSHNTLMVDEQDQQRVEKAQLTFQEKDTRLASAIIEDAYEGVTLERNIRFEPPYIWIEDRCASDAIHRYGWVFHAQGGMTVRPSNIIADLDLPPLSQYGAFAWLKNRKTVSTDGTVCVDWRISDRVWLRLLATSDGPFEITSAQTPGNPIPNGRGSIYLRAKGSSRIFRAAFEIHRGAPNLSELEESAFTY
jgi:hypothetical protein